MCYKLHMFFLKIVYMCLCACVCVYECEERRDYKDIQLNIKKLIISGF